MDAAVMLDATLEDVELDTNVDIPEVVSVKGFPVKEITQHAYRNLAKTLVVPWKKKSKDAIFNAIATKKINLGIYAAQQ